MVLLCPLVFLFFFQGFELVKAHSSASFVRNGDFEVLHGYYPAGIVLRSSTTNPNMYVDQWIVQDGTVEIISSRLWPSSKAESMYAIHLNTPTGPGAIETEIKSALVSGVKYLLSFDIAVSSIGGPPTKRLQVNFVNGRSDTSNVLSKIFSFTFPANVRSRHISWEPVRWIFVHEGRGDRVILNFRSLSPGSHGLFLDNVNLTRLDCEPCDHAESFAESGVSRALEDSTSKSSFALLRERMQLTVGTLFRQRFLRRTDW